MASVFLSAEWRSLLLLNYAIDPAVLAPWTPRGTEIELLGGSAIVSVVGFLFLKTRLYGVPIPFHQKFEEVNLRFYVRRPIGAAASRRGVVFVKEIVPRWAAAAVARARYNENYVTARTAHEVEIDPARGGFARYRWRINGCWNGMEAAVSGPAQPILAASEAEFIMENYWGYTRQRDGGCVEYEVLHPPWEYWSAEEARLECDVEGIYGAPFVDALSAKPHSAFVAIGSEVKLRSGIRCKTGEENLPANGA